MVFRDLGTSCSVHMFAEASVQLRMGCGLRMLNQSGGSEVDCSVSSEADEKCNWSQPDEPGTLRSLESSNDLAMILGISGRGVPGPSPLVAGIEVNPPPIQWPLPNQG
ncbi:uncharacterized protein M6G45_005992 [Spheniscus humboldti]